MPAKKYQRNKTNNNNRKSVLQYYYLPQTYLLIALFSLLVAIPIASVLADLAGAPENGEGITEAIGYPVALMLIVILNAAFSLTVFILHFFIKMTQQVKRTFFNIAVLLWLISMIWLGCQQFNSLMNTPLGGYPGI